MSYRLPPLNGLRAFEAAGRHLSFRRAAEELSVTPGAVSQQVKNLEQALGVPLFQRVHRGLILTEHGEAYLPKISDGFKRISAATDKLAPKLKSQPLRLGISPRLTDSPENVLAGLVGSAKQSEFVRVTSTDEVARLLDGSLDALLRPGAGPYPGMHAETVTLRPAFAPHVDASLIVWPGLAQCRQYLKAKSLLAETPCQAGTTSTSPPQQ